MIDYEKLKMAHELVADTEEYYFEAVFGINGSSSYTIFDTNHDRAGFFDNEDGLLEMLQELTQPEPKYKIGDTVWLIDCDCICTAEIESHGNEEYNIKKCETIDGSRVTVKEWASEDDLHPTKAALIESQIEYWTNLQIDKMGCHENGFSHKWNHTHYQDRKPVHFDTDEYKCRKCDRFYKFENGHQIELDKIKEPEYCNVSGVNLDNHEEFDHPRQAADSLVTGLCAPQVGTTGCEHESDGRSYVTPNQPQMHSKKCVKCKVFYE